MTMLSSTEEGISAQPVDSKETKKLEPGYLIPSNGREEKSKHLPKDDLPIIVTSNIDLKLFMKTMSKSKWSNSSRSSARQSKPTRLAKRVESLKLNNEERNQFHQRSQAILLKRYANSKAANIMKRSQTTPILRPIVEKTVAGETDHSTLASSRNDAIKIQNVSKTMSKQVGGSLETAFGADEHIIPKRLLRWGTLHSKHKEPRKKTWLPPIGLSRTDQDNVSTQQAEDNQIEAEINAEEILDGLLLPDIHQLHWNRLYRPYLSMDSRIETYRGVAFACRQADKRARYLRDVLADVEKEQNRISRW